MLGPESTAMPEDTAGSTHFWKEMNASKKKDPCTRQLVQCSAQPQPQAVVFRAQALTRCQPLGPCQQSPCQQSEWDKCSSQLFGCFLKWWYTQNTPKWSFLVGKPWLLGKPTILGNPHLWGVHICSNYPVSLPNQALIFWYFLFINGKQIIDHTRLMQMTGNAWRICVGITIPWAPSEGSTSSTITNLTITNLTLLSYRKHP